MNSAYKNLPYDPKKLKRELTKHYISLTQKEIDSILKELEINQLSDLFEDIPKNYHFNEKFFDTEEIKYDELIRHMESLSKKNNIKTSFLGNGLNNYKVMEIAQDVLANRGLATAYTPYQPERSQGTLWTHYLYASSLKALTGFEAINASMYDRSTCLYEALNTTIKISRKKHTVLVSSTIYESDIEVIKTLSKETGMNIQLVPTCKKSGLIDQKLLQKQISEHKDDLASLAFPQINKNGLLEDVNALTDLCYDNNILAIAIIDPMLLSNNGLIPPSEFGTKGGAHLFVAEGQHLAVGPNFGGPGLGIFGVRFNSKNKLMIRSTPGRYTSIGKDKQGNEALTMVLSTREQHIRRDKASSNICSNEAYIATVASATLLQRGAEGISNSANTARNIAKKAYSLMTSFEGFSSPYNTAFFNEFVIKVPNINELISNAAKNDLHIGVNVSNRFEDDNYLLMSFFDIHSDNDLLKLETFLDNFYTKKSPLINAPEIPNSLLRKSTVSLPSFSRDELNDFYHRLGKLNVSPDDDLYPLGSCTMKYNPYINEYAAGLDGFNNIHPNCPESDAQGSLEILYEIQEMFKQITGLPGVALQPVAGAQGELCGLKMFQAYHRDNNEGDIRNILLIPKSAHGTNPATATMAGLLTKKVDGVFQGIVEIEADEKGQIDMDQLRSVINEYKNRICGIMVTNPNTSGIWESNFLEMADLIHEVGGLVYMDGANMNAIAGHINLKKLGVDAVHNNLHKTWSIPHGGGGPGDAIVAVSEKLIDFIPGVLVKKTTDGLRTYRPKKTIGSMHRHFGNIGHKIRAYTYLLALGNDGIKKMSAIAVLSARYLFKKIQKDFPTLPKNTCDVPRMHEFIITLNDSDFQRIQEIGIPKTSIIPQIGKLFLDFGLHAPTVAFPEAFGLMIEPTESFSKSELDRFISIIKAMRLIINEHPEVLKTVPHFTPVSKVDEVDANKNLCLSREITSLPKIPENKISPEKLSKMNIDEIITEILSAHNNFK